MPFARAGAALAAPASLPGDADCDGLITAADALQLTREFTDGDGSAATDVDGGTLPSCAGADVNGDGVVTAADLSALARLLAGDDGSTGPVITYLGVASAGGTTSSPVGDMPAPIYQTVTGLGFRLVIEAAPGRSGLPVGQNLFNSRPDDPTARPDLQPLVSHALGDGNAAVCGEGGVPAVAPPSYGPQQAIANSLNDLACRFDVTGNPSAACTLDQFGAQGFVDPRSRVQFCLPVSNVEAFAAGATLVTVRARDIAGNPGPLAQMFLLVGDEPLPTLTPRPTATLAPSPTVTATRTATATGRATDTVTVSPTLTQTATRSATATLPTVTATETRTVSTATASGTATESRTPTATPNQSATAMASPTRTTSATRIGTSTVTPTITPTPSATRTTTVTRTASRTPTHTFGPSPTASSTPPDTPTRTRTRTPTRTASVTRTASPTSTATRTLPATVTATSTIGPSPTRTSTRAATSTRTATRTPTHTATSAASATRTGTPTVTPTRSITATRTMTASRTATGTRTATRTVTVTGTPPATFTATATRTRTRTMTRTATLTASVTRTPSQTRTPSATGTVTRTASATRTGTATATFTASRTPTITRTATRTPTVTRTPTITLTPSITPTPTITRTPTATPRPGADVTFIGLARPSNDMILEPDGMTPEGWPIYTRPYGYNFTVVVEAKPGPSHRPVGLNAFRWDPFDPNVRPDLEIIVSRPLGDGSTAVCDDMLPMLGGIPPSTSFDPLQPVSDAINDLACRFVNGDGAPGGRGAPNLACTLFPDGEYAFVDASSKAQFCASIAEPFGFPLGDTTVTVRVRDISGQPGPPASMVVRVQP